jgi:hypothetical protein
MNDIVLHTHLGLGDMFICNGLIRKFVAQTTYNRYYVVCKKHYMPSVEQMYSDNDKIIVVPIEGRNEYQEVINLRINAPVLRIGHEHLRQDIHFDQAFYEQLGFKLSDKYTESKVARNTENEDKCYDEHVPVGEEYIFVHDESSVGTFDLSLPSDYKVVKPTSRKFSLPSYLKVIENAKEVHCIDSSFFHMIDITLNRDNLYYHNSKVNIEKMRPTLREGWTIINYENN